MQQYDEPSDEAIIHRLVLKPNHSDFAVLVNRHQSRLRLYLRGLCGNQAIADELAQETLLKVYRAVRQFKHQSSFKTWMISIARNTYFDHARLLKHQVHHDSSPPFSMEELFLLQSVETYKSPNEGDMLTLDIEKAINALNKDERDVIVHCYFADLTMAETSATLNLPLGTVKTHASRALAKMRQSLSDWKK